MSAILYYSNHCEHSKDLLYQLSRSEIKNELHFVCIDNRAVQKDGSQHITLENGEVLSLPKTVTKVPAVLLLHHGNRVIDGLAEIKLYLNPAETKIAEKATASNGEPLAFSLDAVNSMSDTYSYLDMSTDELSAKGSGGLREMHHYDTLTQDQTIATPPDDYEPNKVGAVDLGAIQEKRNLDISINK